MSRRVTLIAFLATAVALIAAAPSRAQISIPPDARYTCSFAVSDYTSSGGSYDLTADARCDGAVQDLFHGGTTAGPRSYAGTMTASGQVRESPELRRLTGVATITDSASGAQLRLDHQMLLPSAGTEDAGTIIVYYGTDGEGRRVGAQHPGSVSLDPAGDGPVPAAGAFGLDLNTPACPGGQGCDPAPPRGWFPPDPQCPEDDSFKGCWVRGQGNRIYIFFTPLAHAEIDRVNSIQIPIGLTGHALVAMRRPHGWDWDCRIPRSVLVCERNLFEGDPALEVGFEYAIKLDTVDLQPDNGSFNLRMGDSGDVDNNRFPVFLSSARANSPVYGTDPVTEPQDRRHSH